MRRGRICMVSTPLERLIHGYSSLNAPRWNNTEISEGNQSLIACPFRIPKQLDSEAPKECGFRSLQIDEMAPWKRLVVPVGSRRDELKLRIEKILIEFFVFTVHYCEHSACRLWSYSIYGLGDDSPSSIRDHQVR